MRNEPGEGPDLDLYSELTKVLDAAAAADSAEQIPGITGYSGMKIIALLRHFTRLLGDGSCAYVEVGVFQGLTLLSVAHAAPTVPVFGIDNFSQFDPENENRGLVESRRASLGLENVTLIDRDYELALASLRDHIGSRDVAVYFIDGPHDYRSQMMCLELMLPYLAENAVIIVDDSNYEHVRQANADFLRTRPEFALLFEAYTGTHPSNMEDRQHSDATSGWWNGINVLVCDPTHQLERIYPETSSDRIRYVNDHVVHSEQNGDLAPEAVALANAVLSWNPARVLARVIKLHRAARAENRYSLGDFRHCNVGETPPTLRRASRRR